MSRLEWDLPEDRILSFGVDQGVLYSRIYGPIVWNGLISVAEKITDSNVRVGYFDGKKYIQQRSTEGFSASIEAFTYPDGYLETPFDFCYRVSLFQGYELHLVYNAVTSVDDSDYSTTDDSPNATIFKWDLSTTPMQIQDVGASSHLVIDSNRTYPWVLTALEDALYGSEGSEPRMLNATEVVELFDSLALFRVIDHGDGTWTAIGPDEWITMTDPTTFRIITPSAEYIDPQTYRIRSW